MSPCCNRTQAPSFRSMAGNRITSRSPLLYLPPQGGGRTAKLFGWGSRLQYETPTRPLRGHPPPCRGRERKQAVQPSRLPLQKIADQSEAQFLALLRMELRADHIIARDDGGDRPAVIGLGQQVCRVFRLELIGVHEIGVQAARAKRDAVE